MIRAAVAADVAAVADLEQDNLGNDAWSEGLIATGVAGELPTVVYLVAELDSRVVAYAAASIVADIAELQRIAVDPTYRRRGLAAALVTELVTRSTTEGADRLLLEVREDNAGALAFYVAAGFEEIDRRRRYYRDGATAVVMRRALGPTAHP